MGASCTIKGPDKAIPVGGGAPLVVIAGPCVLEARETHDAIAQALRDACAELGLSLVFKASYDKANRTSIGSPRGPGMQAGLTELARIRDRWGLAVTTDIHDPAQAEPASSVVDVLQIPAFLCRQTDLLLAAGRAAAARGRVVNVKKGQFVSPREMTGPVGKLVESGCREIMLTERGTFFGYHRLVTDLIGLGDLMEVEASGVRPPVCFDCTHSAQLPGESATTGGRRERIPLLARAAVAAGVPAIFMECHPRPSESRSDAGTVLPLEEVPALLSVLSRLHRVVHGG